MACVHLCVAILPGSTPPSLPYLTLSFPTSLLFLSLYPSPPLVKLCDFGFARAMSTQTIVLTSIKGTPLYVEKRDERVKRQRWIHKPVSWHKVRCCVYSSVICVRQVP